MVVGIPRRWTVEAAARCTGYFATSGTTCKLGVASHARMGPLDAMHGVREARLGMVV